MPWAITLTWGETGSAKLYEGIMAGPSGLRIILTEYHVATC